MATKAKSSKTARRVGSWEWVALPEFAISCMRARLDPASGTSRLHADGLTRVEIDGLPGVSFRVYPLPEDERTFVWVEAPLVEAPGIRIRTPVTLGETTWSVELELLAHEPSAVSLILGVRDLSSRFVVDSGAGGLAGPPKIWPRPGEPDSEEQRS